MINSVNVKPLIPHQLPMLMIDSIVNYDDSAKTAILEYTIKASSPFVDSNGKLAPESFLEIIAQAAAAQHGFNLQRNGKPEETGFLVGARGCLVTGKAFAGDKLTVYVACGTEMESVSAVKGEIFNSGEKIFSAGITVWHGTKN